jgi:hypothetical protein
MWAICICIYICVCVCVCVGVCTFVCVCMYVYTIEFYSTIKKNEIMAFAGKCVELLKKNKPDSER